MTVLSSSPSPPSSPTYIPDPAGISFSPLVPVSVVAGVLGAAPPSIAIGRKKAALSAFASDRFAVLEGSPGSEPEGRNRSTISPSMAEDLGMSTPSDSRNPSVCNFIRKPPKGRNIRKRRSDSADAEDDGDEEQPQPSSLMGKPKKTLVHDNKLHFSSTARSSSKSRQAATPVEDDEETEAETSSAAFHFESSKEIQVQNDSRATATLETETEFTRDARAIGEKTLKLAEEKLKGGGRPSGDDKVYHGIHGYTDHKAGFRREQTVSDEKAGGAHGPLRAPVHIRVSARFDYQLDICKDYKETGYCGYGDACKFMHDRGDYKMGWQLEREWEESEKARMRALAIGGGEDGEDDIGGGDDDDDDDSLPFACFICRQPFEDPVVTKCKHYFCEHCALKHYQKNKKCFVCNKPTLGIFNTAHEIKKRMAEVAERK